MKILFLFFAFIFMASGSYALKYEQIILQLDKKEYTKAYNGFLTLSALGNKDAQFNIGVMHLKGEGREKSYSDAYAWFKLAKSEKNEGYTQTFENITNKISKEDLDKGEAVYADITKVYGDDVVTKNTAPEIESFGKKGKKFIPRRKVLPKFPKEAFSDKNFIVKIEARYIIGKDGRTKYQFLNAEANKLFIEKSLEASKKFIYRPQVVNDTPVEAYYLRNQFSFNLGNINYDKQKIYTVLKASEKKAEKGTSDARIQHAFLQNLYKRDIPKEKKQEFKSAMYWNHKAAKDGNPIAQFNLGAGLLISKKGDVNKGLFWLEHAANSSHPKAQMILGLELISGVRVKQNNQQGLAWLEKAAKTYTPAKIEYALALATIKDEALKNSGRAVAIIKDIDSKTVTDLVSLYEAQAVIYYVAGDQKAYKKAHKKFMKQAKKYGLPQDIMAENIINLATGQAIKPLWVAIG